MRRNSQAKGVGDGAHHESFRGAGHAGEQAMAADEDGDENLVEHFGLADDDLAHLSEDVLAYGVEMLNALLEQRCVLIQSGR